MNYKLSTIIFVFLLSFWYCSQQGHETIALVTGYVITFDDIKTVIKIYRLQPGVDTSWNTALYQLKRTYLYLHIADSLGIPVTDSLLQWEARRIATHTLMPQRIDSIRKACGDSLRYIKYFVLPQLLPRWIYAHFLWDKNIHKIQGDSARWLIHEYNNIFKKLTIYEHLSGKGLQLLSQHYHYSYMRYRVDRRNGIQHLTDTKQYGDSTEMPSVDKIPEKINWYSANQLENKAGTLAEQLIENVLKTMKVGQVYPYPIEQADCFWVLQLIDYFNNSYYIAVVILPKTNFYAWLSKQGYVLHP